MKFFLLFISLSIVSCGKGNHAGKIMDHTPKVGVNDPCAEEGRCQYLEYLSLNDPLVKDKFSRYFPNYSFDQAPEFQYEVGQKYSLNNQGYYNQEYDPETGVFKLGCLINFDETRTVYKITHGLVEEAHEREDGTMSKPREYSEVLFFYKKENARNLTPTKECEEFSADFDDEDWKVEEIDKSEKASIDLDKLENLQKDENTDFHIYIIRLDGDYYLKKVFDFKNVEISDEESEDKTGPAQVFIFDRLMITISKPQENSLGNRYDYTKTFVDKKLVEESFQNLSSLNNINIDLTQIPEDY